MTPSEIEQFCIKAKARIEDMVGRDVMIIPIQNWAYAPIVRIADDYRKWVLVIEQDGKTWVWDSVTMEG
tara:strand:+ start:12738 stop:12944 length:207 start_codon:yes stop_codon:yes gene_type:complete